MLVLFAIIFFGQMLYWVAYYPGGFNLDAYGQWDQAHGLQKLNNWHPVFTTMLYWLITRLRDSFAFCIFIQLLSFSISVSYLLAVLNEVGVDNLPLSVSAVYIALNPAICLNNICLFKDVPFTIAVVWLNVALIRIVVSRGEWLSSPLHAFFFFAMQIAVVLIRHNGVFYVAAVAIVLLVFCREYRRRLLVLACALTVSVATIERPLFMALSIEKHGNPVGEMVGLPMSIMVNNYLSDPDNTPDKVKDLLLSIASEDEWRNHYELGEWDSCKWDFGGGDLFRDVSFTEIVRLSLESIEASPDSAYRSLRENTRVVWQLSGDVEWVTWVYIEDNDYGIAAQPNPTCAAFVDEIVKLSTTPLGSLLFWSIGATNVVFLLLSLACAVKGDMLSFAIALAPIAYNLLTMLLLCGPSHRYFYYSSVLALPVLLFLANRLGLKPAGQLEVGRESMDI